jgi:hypothetical protein
LVSGECADWRFVIGDFQLSQVYRTRNPVKVASVIAGSSVEFEQSGGLPTDLSGVRGKTHQALSYAIADHVSATVSMFAICVGLGFFLMYAVVTRHHPYEQAICTLLLSTFIGGAHALLCLIMFALDSLNVHGLLRSDTRRRMEKLA